MRQQAHFLDKYQQSGDITIANSTSSCENDDDDDGDGDDGGVEVLNNCLSPSDLIIIDYNKQLETYHQQPPTKFVEKLSKRTQTEPEKQKRRRALSAPCFSSSIFNQGADLFAKFLDKMVAGKKQKQQLQQQRQAEQVLADSPLPPMTASTCSGRASSKGNKVKAKPLHETGNGTGPLMSPKYGGRNGEDDTVLPPVCSLLPQSSPIPAISNGLTTGEEIVAGKSRVELVRSSEPGRSDLGLILAGGADKEDRLHVISIQPGSTAHRTDRILIGDYITAINGVSTLKLRQTEIMTLIGNSRNSIVFELHYRLCPSAITRPASPPRMHKGSPQPIDASLRGTPIETKRTEIVIPRDAASGPSAGLVLRGGARLDRDRTCPVFIVQIRPGTAIHRDGAIRPGDRILAINGTDLTGLHLDDVYGLLTDFYVQQSAMTNGPNHQPQPLKLLIEYDILKGGFETAVQGTADEWVMEFCRQSGSDIGLSLSAAYVDGKSCMVVDNVRPASFADRTGVIRAGDILLSINGQNVDNKMPSDVMTLLKYGSLSTSTASSPKLGNTLRLQFLRPAQPVPQPFSNSLSSSMTTVLRQESTPPSATTAGRAGITVSQSYHASLTTTSSNNVAKRSATSIAISSGAADVTPTMHSSAVGAFPSTPTLLPRTLGRTADMATASNSLMMPAVNSGNSYPSQPALGVASATNSMNRLKRRGSIGSVTSFSSTCSANGGYVFHSETMDVYIEATSVAADCQTACGGLGANFGLTIQKCITQGSGGNGLNASTTGTIGRSTLNHHHNHHHPHNLAKSCLLSIGAIEYNSPADRIGLLQEGDRVLQINGHSLLNKPPEIAAQLLHDSGPVCQLRVEFDVADSFAISTGVFHVRLPNRGPSLGLAAVSLPSSSVSLQINGTQAATTSQQNRVFISDIRRGSVAYRCGNLLVGDEVISVNSCQLDSVVDLISSIQHAGEIVVLKIRRFAQHHQFYVVTYGVHFEIGDTALGIGLARTDNPFYPFVVTLLEEGGLAYRSGAVHLGDYLVAVNDLDLSGCTLQQLQDTLDSLPSDSLVVLRLCRVGGFANPNSSELSSKSSNGQNGASSSGSQHEGAGRSPGGASSADSSSGAGRSPNSNKDSGGSSATASERGGHVRSVDSAICSDAHPLKSGDHPHDPVALSELINGAMSMSRQSCYDNLKLDPNSGDWVPSSSLASFGHNNQTPNSNNRQLLAALESAIWEMDVAKLKLDVCNGENASQLSKSATLPKSITSPSIVMTRSHLANTTSNPISTRASNLTNVRASKSFGTNNELLSSKPPVQPPHILTANVTSKPVFLATEHFFVQDRPMSGCFTQVSSLATQTEVAPVPQHAALTIVQHHSPALASVTSSSLLVSDDTFDSLKRQSERVASKYIDESPSPRVNTAIDEYPREKDSDLTKRAPLSQPECTETPRKSLCEVSVEETDYPLPEKPFKKSASTRSLRRVSDAIIRRLFDRSSPKAKVKSAKKNSAPIVLAVGN